MDFTFSEEQELLRSTVREQMAARYPIERVAQIADGAGFDRREWPAIAEAGWTGISVSEEMGGAGLGFLEELIVVEELGRALYPGPYFSTVILALGALRTGGAGDADGVIRAIAAGEQTATVAWAGADGRFDTDPAPKVEWDERNGAISATKLFVPGLAVADLVVVVGGVPEGTGYWVVRDLDATGVARRELPTVDTTRRMGELILENTPTSILTSTREPGALAPLRDRALAALAVEAVGAGSAALDLAVDHAKSRRQFGRPIGAFQAVAHELAQAYLEIETARSLAYGAGWAVAEAAPEASAAAAAAKARAAEAAILACERAIQVHGGIGFTWEHPLHRYYKRALGIAATLGSGSELRARVASSFLD